MIIAIPARLSSTRLPNKVLLAETGHPLLWHTIQSAKKSKLAKKILVLTEDMAIYDFVVGLDDEMVVAIPTPPTSSGTDRISKYITNCGSYLDSEIIVNMQADEPELDGVFIDDLVMGFDQFDKIPFGNDDVATLAYPVQEPTSYPNAVKVVVNHAGHAMYFSRSHIPYSGSWLHHVGVYAYTVSFLRQLNKMAKGTYGSEHLEQLQWLQAGSKIKVVVASGISSFGIDTRIDYDRFKLRILGK